MLAKKGNTHKVPDPLREVDVEVEHRRVGLHDVVVVVPRLEEDGKLWLFHLACVKGVLLAVHLRDVGDRMVSLPSV